MRNSVLIMNRPKVTTATMPRTGTKLHLCLKVLMTYHPVPVSTGLVSTRAKMTVSEASAFLSKLLDRGIVEKASVGQGRAGGSEWVLTYGAEIELKLRGG